MISFHALADAVILIVSYFHRSRCANMAVHESARGGDYLMVRHVRWLPAAEGAAMLINISSSTIIHISGIGISAARSILS